MNSKKINDVVNWLTLIDLVQQMRAAMQYEPGPCSISFDGQTIVLQWIDGELIERWDAFDNDQHKE